MKEYRGVWAVLGAVALLVVPTVGFGQAGTPKVGVVPAGVTAESVLAKAGTALGGGTALGKISSVVSKGTFTGSTQTFSLSGTVESYLKLPSSYYSKQIISQTVEGRKQTVTLETGVDGKTGWIRAGESGIRPLPAAQVGQLLEQADVRSAADWRKSFTAAELIGVRKVDGKDAYAVRLTPKAGKPVVRYYDTKTYLMVRMDMIQDSPQGPQPIESYYSDYRKVGGIPMAFTIRQKYAGLDATTKLTSVQINVPIPAARFARPAN
jgi:hypothetical protein